mgnify:CR=1 FL=1
MNPIARLSLSEALASARETRDLTLGRGVVNETAAVFARHFPGRRAVIVLLNALMGLPPVVVGLLVYLLLSRAGPLGSLGLLFTPPAMVIAQTVLVLPIIAAASVSGLMFSATLA